MKKIQLGKHTVEYYDGIDTLPILRFHKYNKMLLIDSGIGSDIGDFDRHLQKARTYYAKGETQKGAQELENLRQNVWMIVNGVSPRHLSFAVLITKIDGEECDDISDEGLKKVVEKLGDIPVATWSEMFDRAKKKDR